MTGPNLSEWVLKHRSFTIFLMIVVSIGGLSSYFSLGRNEDPAFTFRTMVVQAAWPGATMEDTLTQVTERLERQLRGDAGPRLPCAAIRRRA
jgi:multidrug efflux pump subunit AcrB